MPATIAGDVDAFHGKLLMLSERRSARRSSLRLPPRRRGARLLLSIRYRQKIRSNRIGHGYAAN